MRKAGSMQAFLLVMVLAYYLSITAYCTPYNALIPELGHTQERLTFLR